MDTDMPTDGMNDATEAKTCATCGHTHKNEDGTCGEADCHCMEHQDAPTVPADESPM